MPFILQAASALAAFANPSPILMYAPGFHSVAALTQRE